MKVSFQSRCVVLCSVLVVGLSALSARLVQIQLVNRKVYEESSRRTYHRTEILHALRGMIVDRNEEPLARSIPVSTVYVDKYHLTDPRIASVGVAYLEASAEPGWEKLSAELQRRRIFSLRGEILTRYRDHPEVIIEKHLAAAVEVLSRPLGMRRDELHDAIVNNRGKDFAIAKNVPQDVADELRDIRDRQWIQGIRFENGLKRWYTAPEQATHLIGFTGEVEEKDKDGDLHAKMVGKFGVESSMDAFLAGQDGTCEHYRDTTGMVIPGNPETLKPARSGLNVKLTIDMGIQSIVEEELDAAMKEFKAKRGSVVLMDPKTGEVLGMASRPHFNLNDKKGLDQPNVSINYAIQAIYEPGSTIKIVATSGALNEGLVNPQTSINCYNGFWQGRGYKVEDDYPASSLTFEQVLQKSNNNGTYSIGRQLGSRRFYEYLHNYGFGKKTGIQLSGESSGMARDTNNEADFSRACFGYATNVTPLQLACAYSVIAGDGKLRKPHIVKSIVANDGYSIEDYAPEVVRQVLKPKTASQMRQALEKVTQLHGTATRAAVPGFRVAGKTGTVRKHNPLGGYSKDRYIGSFVGMMPAQDPTFVCVVVIDDPHPETHGGIVAAPAFRKIATRVAAHMNLQPTEPITTTSVAAAK